MHPSVFANLALLLWAPVALLVTRAMSTAAAVTFIMVGGVMFLPEKLAFRLPLLSLDKDAISAIAACIVCVTRAPQRPLPPATRASTYLLGFLAVSFAITTATNRESLRFGPVHLPGLGIKDTLGLILADVLQIVLPFYVGQRVFRSPKELEVLLRGLVIGALVYLPLVLLEARLSPILHTKLYGFFQHAFGQSKREGGFRAFVFMQHGLAVAFYMSQALTTAMAFLRSRTARLPVATPWVIALLALGVVSCKSLGALGYAILTTPLILMCSPRLQIRIMRWLSVVILLYPLLRLEGWFPAQTFVDWAMQHDPDRGRSLEFRIYNEEVLLERTREKLWFGWGSWGRNRVFDEGGVDNTVVDGEWIAILGGGGVARFAIVFGCILLPVFLAEKARRKLDSDDARLLAVTTVLLTFVAVEMLPNSVWYPLPYLLGGAAISVCRDLTRTKVPTQNPAPGRPAPEAQLSPR